VSHRCSAIFALIAFGLSLSASPEPEPLKLLQGCGLRDWKVFDCISRTTPPINGYSFRHGIASATLRKTLPSKEAEALRASFLRLIKADEKPAVAILEPNLVFRIGPPKAAFDILVDSEHKSFAISMATSTSFGHVSGVANQKTDWARIAMLVKP
jgi:hypothetical protein